MTIANIVEAFNKKGFLQVAEIIDLHKSGTLRRDMYNFFQRNTNRDFAKAVLTTLMVLRGNLDNEVYIEDLMLPAYIIGMHGFVEDSLLIWEAKNIDFDTYWGFDTELIVFAGIDETIAFLNNANSPQAKKALDFVIGLADEDVDYYYSNIKEQYWIN